MLIFFFFHQATIGTEDDQDWIPNVSIAWAINTECRFQTWITFIPLFNISIAIGKFTKSFLVLTFRLLGNQTSTKTNLEKRDCNIYACESGHFQLDCQINFEAHFISCRMLHCVIRV